MAKSVKELADTLSRVRQRLGLALSHSEQDDLSSAACWLDQLSLKPVHEHRFTVVVEWEHDVRQQRVSKLRCETCEAEVTRGA